MLKSSVFSVGFGISVVTMLFIFRCKFTTLSVFSTLALRAPNGFDLPTVHVTTCYVYYIEHYRHFRLSNRMMLRTVSMNMF